jgi:hypothetical protein
VFTYDARILVFSLKGGRVFVNVKKKIF